MKSWDYALRLAVALLVVAALCAAACSVVVRQHEMAVITRFGEPIQVVTAPGLYWRLPYPVDSVRRLDRRIRYYETRFAETLTQDKLNVIVLTYVVWRIEDPLRFMKAFPGGERFAEVNLDGLVTHAKNTVLGNYKLSALVSTNPEDLKVLEIEEKVLGEVRPLARKQYGFDVIQVGIKRLAFPEKNVPYVFDKMRADRAYYAGKHRSEGERLAAAIRSATDLKKAEILAQAREKAERIRGQGEAEAARIYADAYRQDPDFYLFLRSLESLKKVLGARSTVILRTDSLPFSVLRASHTSGPDPAAKVPSAPPTPAEPAAGRGRAPAPQGAEGGAPR